MANLLYPKEYLSSPLELNPQKLKSKGIKTVIFDIDNTLVPYFVKKPTPQVLKLFKDLKRAGLNIAVLSNSKEERSRVFLEGLKIPYVCKAKKPLNKGLKRLMTALSIKPHECLIVGDQIFTDVLLGNLNGIYTVLVKKANKKDELITAVKRPLEKIVLYFYLRSIKNERKQN